MSVTLFRNRANSERNSKKRIIMTCCEGEVVDIANSKNRAISMKILGEGFCVHCSVPSITAPISGKVTDISDNGHTYTITGNDGVCILVCIEASEKNEELESMVSVGDSVVAGDELCAKENAEAAVIVVNSEIMSKFRIVYGKTRTGKDGVIVYEL